MTLPRRWASRASMTKLTPRATRRRNRPRSGNGSLRSSTASSSRTPNKRRIDSGRGVSSTCPGCTISNPFDVMGETHVVTEKLHGQNASYVSDGKRLFCKSRTRWRDVEDDNSWANVARRYDLEWKLSKRPFVLLFGETYGNNADMAYGVDKTKEGSDRFAAFDAYDTKKGQWLNHFEFENFCNELDIPMAPRLATIQWGPDSYEYLLPFAEGETTMRGAKHVREGFVVKAANERPAGLPRAILKLAGEGYHTRKAAA
jgi:hypothetical protein